MIEVKCRAWECVVLYYPMLMFDYAYVLMCGLARLRSVMAQRAVCEYIIMLECSNVLMFEQIFSSGSK